VKPLVPVALVYGGLALAVAGAFTLSLAAATVGLLAIAAGVALPAPEQRIAAVETRLDEWLPAWQFNEVHSIRIAASPEEVFAATKAVTPVEMPLFQILTWIRRGGRGGADQILNAPARRPVLETATRTGFMTLAEDPAREIVVGLPICAGTREPLPATPAAFRTLAAPGFAKAAMAFRVESEEGRCRLETETRVFATDARAVRRFAAYWRVIYPGSALIRREWLRAIRRRAERNGRSPDERGRAARER